MRGREVSPLHILVLLELKAPWPAALDVNYFSLNTVISFNREIERQRGFSSPKAFDFKISTQRNEPFHSETYEGRHIFFQWSHTPLTRLLFQTKRERERTTKFEAVAVLIAGLCEWQTTKLVLKITLEVGRGKGRRIETGDFLFIRFASLFPFSSARAR